MLHPNVVTVFLVVLGFAWFTAVLVWPKRKAGQRNVDLISIENAPHVDILFSLPREQSAAPFWAAREVPLRVENTNNCMAYDVKIQDKESRSYRATFGVVPRLPNGKPEIVTVDIRQKPSGTYYSSFEALLRFEYEDQPSSESGEIRVPITVQFRDSRGNLFQTEHEITYEAFFSEAKTFLVKGTMRVQNPTPNGASQV